MSETKTTGYIPSDTEERRIIKARYFARSMISKGQNEEETESLRNIITWMKAMLSFTAMIVTMTFTFLSTELSRWQPLKFLTKEIFADERTERL